MRAQSLGYAAGFAMAIAMAGCGRSTDVTTNQDTNSASLGVHADEPAQPTAIKLSGYTQSYNKLIGTFGLTETADSYMKEKIVGQSASDSISITDGWIYQGADDLKKARALPGAGKLLNQAANHLQETLDKVLARLNPLKIYYDSKSYEEDGLARGKREDPLMRADFTAALQALETFNGALKIERNQQTESDLAALKAKGNMLAYDTKLALHQGETLVDLFASGADLKNAAVFAKSDVIITAMEATLADQRKQFADAKTKAATGEGPDSDYASTADSLTSMVGEYRDLRQSHSGDDFNSMVKEYNSAVEDVNNIHR